MALYLVSYSRGTQGIGAYASDVLDLGKLPETEKEFAEIQSILAIQCEADGGIFVSCDRLVSQEEHPCTGVPYAYHVVYQLQHSVGETAIAVIGVGAMQLLRDRPVTTLEDLRKVEAFLCKRYPKHDKTVLMRLIPVSGLDQKAIDDFLRLCS